LYVLVISDILKLPPSVLLVFSYSFKSIGQDFLPWNGQPYWNVSLIFKPFKTNLEITIKATETFSIQFDPNWYDSLTFETLKFTETTNYTCSMLF